jgi:RimJ/RimL family protein N-acetyltransferase
LKNETVTIVGERLRLRPLDEAALALKVRWYNDPEIRKTLILDERLELEGTRRWFERIAGDAGRCDLVIEMPEGTPVGLISLLHIDRRHKTAEIIVVIGEKDYWGKGVMAEAESLLMGWAFESLGLEKIWAQARPENLASLITMKKLGFQIEGTLRQDVIQDGRRIDILRLGLLKDEFKPAVRRTL